MSKDIQPLLDGWPYDSGKLCVRRIKGEDGREKIQLRIEMGILQMDVLGRPDGQRPNGYESLLHYYKARAQETRLPQSKNGKFILDTEACLSLQMEALQYYHRRISFLEIGDYSNAKKDAQRNLSLFDFVKEYAEDEEDRLAMEHYRPFVIGHRVRAEVLLELENGNYDQALRNIQTGIGEIQRFFQEFDRPDLVEESEEILFLKEWAEEIRKDKPRSLSQDLHEQLKDAVATEDFERAAELRDQILALSGKKTSTRTPSIDNA